MARKSWPSVFVNALVFFTAAFVFFASAFCVLHYRAFVFFTTALVFFSTFSDGCDNLSQTHEPTETSNKKHVCRF